MVQWFLPKNVYFTKDNYMAVSDESSTHVLPYIKTQYLSMVTSIYMPNLCSSTVVLRSGFKKFRRNSVISVMAERKLWNFVLH
jgi:hypothetical protein